MALLDRFKSKKKETKANKDEPNVLDMVQEPVAKKTEKVVLKENTGTAHRVLHHYHLSEKTNLFSATGRYVFKVDPHTNKIEVKKAIEKVYDVHVVRVNIMKVPGKNRRQGKSVGRTQEWKKAIVTLKEGERISGLAEGV